MVSETCSLFLEGYCKKQVYESRLCISSSGLLLRTLPTALFSVAPVWNPSHYFMLTSRKLTELQVSILVTERIFTAYSLYSIIPDFSVQKHYVFRFFYFIIFTLSLYKNSEYTFINNSAPSSGFSNFLSFIDAISSRCHFIHTPSYALFISNVKSMTNSSFTHTTGGEPVFAPLMTSNFCMWISVWLVDVTLCDLVRRNLQW